MVHTSISTSMTTCENAHSLAANSKYACGHVCVCECMHVCVDRKYKLKHKGKIIIVVGLWEEEVSGGQPATFRSTRFVEIEIQALERWADQRLQVRKGMSIQQVQ